MLLALLEPLEALVELELLVGLVLLVQVEDLGLLELLEGMEEMAQLGPQVCEDRMVYQVELAKMVDQVTLEGKV